MLPFFRTLSICAVCILICTGLFAGNSSVRPFSPLPAKFLISVKKLDSNFIAEKIASHKIVKICSCQILNVQSNNYDHRKVAVFAEKTNNGNFSADSRVAKEAIEKEKKHLKAFFYDKLKVVGHVAESSDCKSLYVKLKSADEDLVMYDILDADAQF